MCFSGRQRAASSSFQLQVTPQINLLLSEPQPPRSLLIILSHPLHAGLNSSSPHGHPGASWQELQLQLQEQRLFQARVTRHLLMLHRYSPRPDTASRACPCCYTCCQNHLVTGNSDDCSLVDGLSCDCLRSQSSPLRTHMPCLHPPGMCPSRSRCTSTRFVPSAARSNPSWTTTK